MQLIKQPRDCVFIPGSLSVETKEKYLGGAVDVIRVFLRTSGQSNVGDVLHWVGQGQQHLTLLYIQDEMFLLINQS